MLSGLRELLFLPRQGYYGLFPPAMMIAMRLPHAITPLGGLGELFEICHFKREFLYMMAEEMPDDDNIESGYASQRELFHAI